ncbi:MAG: hypothetical protein K2G97_03680, partial [Oscillospiraceae bacterium]|nr:hypothetical protein [Oscillospiraceae bacterium]
TISNFKIQNKSDKGKNAELSFINTLNEYAEIKNVKFDNYTIEGKSDIKKTAGLIVTNHGIISGVDIINGSINNIGKKASASGYVFNNEKDGVIENCHIENIGAKDSNLKSGFVEKNYGKITNCSTTLSVNSKDSAGGFVSENVGDIEQCSSQCNVDSKKCAGGFCANNEGNIVSCNAEGSVKSKTNIGTTKCGGFVGENSGIIKNCSSTGAIEGQEYVGGFCGYNKNIGKIDSSKSKSNVKSKTNIKSIHCGGFVGVDEGKIENCTFEGKADGCVDFEKLVGIGVGVTIGAILIIICVCLSIKRYKINDIFNRSMEKIEKANEKYREYYSDYEEYLFNMN